MKQGFEDSEHRLGQGLREQDDKMNRNQSVLESIMAQNQVETDRRLDRLHEQLKEQEIVLEDEVARLEVYLGERLDAVDLKLDETATQVCVGMVPKYLYP